MNLSGGITFDHSPTPPTPPPTTPPKRITGWLLRHGAVQNPANMPAVAPSVNARPVIFDIYKQFLQWEIFKEFAPNASLKNWQSVYSGDQWATNGNGWDMPKHPDEQYHDYVGGRYTNYPDPKLMKGIIMQGGLYQGKVEAINGINYLVMYPGVHAANDYTNYTLLEVLANGWFFRCVNAPAAGKLPYDFSQGQGDPVMAIHFLKDPTPYPLGWFKWWDDVVYPDPLRIYP